MSDTFSKVEVITGVARRRRFRTEQKLAVVAETMQPGMSISYVARRHGLSPSLVFRWRRLMSEDFDIISRAMMPYAWIGSIAVAGFFAISGYLVTASFMNRSVSAFITSRALRLYPAVVVYSLVAILIIGPLSAKVPLSQYFAANPWNNLINAGLWEWIYNLPYAFAGNPIPGATNGATWTLPVELRCYLIVLGVGFFGALEGRMRANIAWLLLLYAVKFHPGAIHLFGAENRFAEPLTFFICGALFWINRDYIPMSWALAAIAFASPFIGANAGVYHHVAAPAITYLILMLAYKAPHIDMDRFGDLSYSTYLYAWPVQQMVWTPGQTAYANMALATAIVFPVAYVSWHFVESPALKLRNFLDRKIQRRVA